MAVLSLTGKAKGLVHSWGGSTALFFAFMHFSADLCATLLVPLLPLIRTDFGLSYLQAGFLLSAFNVISGFSQFLGGSLGSRFGLPLVAAIGLGATGLATVVSGLSPTYSVLLILMIVLGLFSGGYHPASASMLSLYFQPGKRGKVVGLHMVGGTAALVAAPVVGGLIADALNWHFAFIILGLPAIAASWLVFPVLKKVKPVEAEEARQIAAQNIRSSGGESRWAAIWQDWRPIAAVVALIFVSQIAVQSATAFIPLYFVDKAQTAALGAALLVGILRLGGLPGSFFGGWLVDRWGGRNSAAVSLALTGPILLMVALTPVGVFGIVALMAYGAILIIRQAAVQTFLMDNTAPRIRPVVFGIYFGLSHEGASIAQPIVGYLMDIHGIGPVFLYLALASVAVSLPALMLLRQGRHKPSPKPFQTA